MPLGRGLLLGGRQCLLRGLIHLSGHPPLTGHLEEEAGHVEFHCPESADDVLHRPLAVQQVQDLPLLS